MKIGLTGTNAAGKTCVVMYLMSRGFEYFSLSDIIREELSRRGLEHSRENLRRTGNKLRERHGASVLADKILGQIHSDRVVIDSIRNVAEVEALRKSDDFILIAIDAPIETRFKRASYRGRLEDAPDLESFKNLEDKEKSKASTSQNIDQCMLLADYLLLNDGEQTDLYHRIDEILQKVSVA